MGYEIIEEIPYDEVIMPTCPSCRMTVPFEARTCPHCGYPIVEGEKKKEVEVKEAAPAPKKRKDLGKKGIAAGSIIVLALLGLLSAVYFPPAIMLVILVMVILISLSCG